jgi:hypothetical protein
VPGFFIWLGKLADAFMEHPRFATHLSILTLYFLIWPFGPTARTTEAKVIVRSR